MPSRSNEANLTEASGLGRPGGDARAQRPLIGVTTSEVRMAEQVTLTPHGEPPRREMALGLTYLRAIEFAGGVPVVIPPLPVEAIEELVGNLHGVVLSGGPDIHPEAYGERPHPELGPTWRDLDVTELALARLAIGRELPLLAICRGAQALNIARGGTLFQHLPERFGRSIEHRQLSPGASSTHMVEVAEDSLLTGALGVTELEVNSFHHQSTSGLGRGLRAVAWAPDGVIEGVEVPGRTFTIGVQWHAEGMTESPPQARLFRSFVEAAAEEAVGEGQRAAVA